MVRLLGRRNVRGTLVGGYRERGFVSLVVLSVMLVMTIFFYASYRIVLFDYEVVSKSSDLRGVRLQQSNISEMVKNFYGDDMLMDVPYDHVGYDVAVDEDLRELFKDELRNYSYTYVLGDDGKIDDRVEWLRFRNYESRVSDGGESREHFVKDNWFDVTSSVYDSDRKSLLLPDRVYVRVKFDPSVYRAELAVGSDYETKTFDLVNRGSDLILALDDLPRSVEKFSLSSGGMLGSTSIELMIAREVDLVVRENDVFNEKDELSKGVLKTIRISLSKWSLDVGSVDVGK